MGGFLGWVEGWVVGWGWWGRGGGMGVLGKVVVVVWVGFGVHGVMVRDVVAGGGRMGGGMGDGGEEVGCGVGGVLVSFEISQGLRIFGHGGSRSQR